MFALLTNVYQESSTVSAKFVESMDRKMGGKKTRFGIDRDLAVSQSRICEPAEL